LGTLANQRVGLFFWWHEATAAETWGVATDAMVGWLRMIPYTLPPYEQRTIDLLARADKSFMEIVHTLPNEWPEDGRTAAFYALQSLGLEHLRAIIKLCESGYAIGSAMALFRPMIDAIVRAEWLYFCAAPLILQQFWKGEFRFPGQKYKFEQLAAEVDEKVGDTDRLSVYGEYYSKFSDWTHGGYHAAGSRFSTTGDIEAAYSDSHIRLLLGCAVAFVQLHVRQMADKFNYSVDFSETPPWTDQDISG
jgi:hypothetical protein